MKATAIAHSNIALVKYWGKRDVELNLPSAGSVSLTLAGMETRTTVEFHPRYSADQVELNGNLLAGVGAGRVSALLDLIREEAGLDVRAHVETVNNFPTSSGLASSASGFAALAKAAVEAADLQVSDEHLSILARRGSGSAARSIFGGFVHMQSGERSDGRDAYARQLHGSSHWGIRCLVALTSEEEKPIGSTDGMNRTMATSPYYESWVRNVQADVEDAVRAIAERNFSGLGDIAERSCLRMHASAMAARPGVLYWNGATVEVIHAVRRARDAGLSVFFTVDAGPHVKVFCPLADEDATVAMLTEIPGVRRVLSTRPGHGARLVQDD
jgi:diphosphomevalonate decarboxylase